MINSHDRQSKEKYRTLKAITLFLSVFRYGGMLHRQSLTHFWKVMTFQAKQLFRLPPQVQAALVTATDNSVFPVLRKRFGNLQSASREAQPKPICHNGLNRLIYKVNY